MVPPFPVSGTISEIDKRFYNSAYGGTLHFVPIRGFSSFAMLIGVVFAAPMAMIMHNFFSIVMELVSVYDYSSREVAISAGITFLIGCLLAERLFAKPVAQRRLKKFLEDEAPDISERLYEKLVALYQGKEVTSWWLVEMERQNLIYFTDEKADKAVLQGWISHICRYCPKVLEEYINGRTAKL